MTGLQSAVAAISAVVLFIYALQEFSRELQAVGALVHESKSARVSPWASVRHAASFCEIGIPSDDIRFNMLHAVMASTR